MREIYFGAVLFKLVSSEGNFIFEILTYYDLYSICVTMKRSGCKIFPKKNLKFLKSRSSRVGHHLLFHLKCYQGWALVSGQCRDPGPGPQIPMIGTGTVLKATGQSGPGQKFAGLSRSVSCPSLTATHFLRN